MKKIGEWLVECGVISYTQLEQALTRQASLKEHKLIGQILVEMEFITIEEHLKYVHENITVG